MAFIYFGNGHATIWIWLARYSTTILNLFEIWSKRVDECDCEEVLDVGNNQGSPSVMATKEWPTADDQYPSRKQSWRGSALLCIVQEWFLSLVSIRRDAFSVQHDFVQGNSSNWLSFDTHTIFYCNSFLHILQSVFFS